ncbi:hypothetical protein Kpol_325p6 [Vanderwaltozyma polyspora DSM 70294]|uniref:Cystinosin n=1 Tax=Vanderwaltozyma polyspora (strain ATCC 22028 / DSM 70294 / BCRC 21397 / CBS 2163 / NBRC 10782 / NRRL Y-8283 / UCD 57-17) TaxID=436907 RepID=A7TST9_VANPO|nr:uncharacterized protein Kpol_325p6 [Vanderwaltozyma polyspora DSM 70294]EDO14667.1 hypothetical protein Kpol_325p6 [Vanderwaltozyma polyspora DSM 70294]
MVVSLDEILGFIYVVSWSISMYTPVVTNWRLKSSSAISSDFVILNTVGYFYLTISLYLQLHSWMSPVKNYELNTITEDDISRPKVTDFDLIYTTHGLILNLVLLSQVRYPKLWRFNSEKHSRMKPSYKKFLISSLTVFVLITIHFYYDIQTYGWNNNDILSYCNKLFTLKLFMSLIKYIPQVKHNYERKTMKGFSIKGVLLDAVGGIASLLQLILELYYEDGFTFVIFITNFGKIGLGLVTLVFDFIFISQWSLYRKIK